MKVRKVIHKALLRAFVNELYNLHREPDLGQNICILQRKRKLFKCFFIIGSVN